MRKRGELNLSKSLFESLKEPLRLAIFAGVSALITSLISSFEMFPDEAVFGVLVLVLRWVDKFLHTSGKAELGLTRF